MKTLIILIDLILLARLVYMIVDVHSMKLLLSKDIKLVKVPNEMDKKYQFIRRLF